MNKELILNNLKKRWSLTNASKISYDHIIFKKVIDLISKLSANKYIMIYWPIENEVDTVAIIHELLQKKYLVCIPYISKDNKLSFKKISSINFEYGWYKNCKIPLTGEIIPIKNISVMIFPLVIFNSKNYFSNYSNKSFFDEIFINDIKTLKIGLAYDFQKNDKFESSSILFNKLDKIITN